MHFTRQRRIREINNKVKEKPTSSNGGLGTQYSTNQDNMPTLGKILALMANQQIATCNAQI